VNREKLCRNYDHLLDKLVREILKIEDGIGECYRISGVDLGRYIKVAVKKNKNRSLKYIMLKIVF
jgi:hypothetical protein